jgi:ankyrin repeat protein
MSKKRQRFMKRDIDDELVRELHGQKPSLKRIECLLDRGANVNAVDQDGCSVLMQAVIQRRLPARAVELLIQRGADAKAVNKSGETVLERALWNPNLKVRTVEWLLAHGVDVNAASNAGVSILAYAVSSPSVPIDVIRCLIEHGADVHAVNQEDAEKLPLTFRTVLGRAVFANRYDAVQVLLEHGLQIRSDDEVLLHLACMEGGPEMMDLLIRAGLNPTLFVEPGRTGLDLVEDFRAHLLISGKNDNFAKLWADRLFGVGKVLFDSGVRRARTQDGHHPN